MDFTPLEKILAKIAQKPEWEIYRQHIQVLECWQKIVSKNTAKHTRPLYISRQVLWVATSSSARAQDLSFQRYGLLKKLNARLSFKIVDIRFSPSKWQEKTEVVESAIDKETSERIVSASQVPKNQNNKREKSTPTDSKAALNKWLKLIQERSRDYLPCPKCSAPTPPKELKRWDSCYHCIANKWSAEYRL